MLSYLVVVPSNSSGQRQLATDARSRLAALGEKKPPTTAAKLRELWPELKAAVDKGHRLKAICDCLEADGLFLNPRTLAAYTARMRRDARLSKSRRPESLDQKRQTITLVPAESGPAYSDAAPARDPLANLRQGQSKRQAFDYRPELADPDKLI